MSPARPTTASHWRYLLALGAVGIGLACLLELAVAGAQPYVKLQALGGIVYHENGFRQLGLRLSPARWQLLRAGLLLGLLGSAALVWWPGGLSLWAALRAEARRGYRHGRAWWQRQSRGAHWAAAGLLAIVTAARLWYFLHYPLGTDEVASYDFFVHRGLAAIGCFYPIPNNHIFYNLLAWPLAQLGCSPALTMRLPSLLWGTLGTVVGGLLLARLTGLRQAVLVLGLLGLAPLWVYYASNGRGYFVQFGLLQIGFFAAVELLRPTSPYHRLSWLGFVASSVLGLYTIPTYAYPLAALGLGLGAGLLSQRRGRALGELALASGLLLFITFMLYAPAGTVSGWDRLLGNRYVTARSAAQFWPQYRAVLYEMAAELFGPSLRLSGPAWLVLAAFGGLASWRWVPAGPRRTLALLAWLQVALPLGLMAAQRVYAPTRTVLYVSFFAYLLVVLLGTQMPGLRQLPERLKWLLTLGAVLGIGGYRLRLDQARVLAAQQETQHFQRAFRWLQQHQQPAPSPTRVWLRAPLHELFFSHYVKLTPVRLLLYSGQQLPPPGRYDFLVLNTGRGSSGPRPASPYRIAYHDEMVTIYAAP